MNKKGAIELSIGTIVIIVLAMSMLILGLLLVKGIFSGATTSVNILNDKVKAQIVGLFGDESREVTVNLGPDKLAKIPAGNENFGIAIGARTLDGSSTDRTRLQYKLSLEDTTTDNCLKQIGRTATEKLFLQKMDTWMPFDDFSGDAAFAIVTVIAPKGTNLCTQKVYIDVKDTQTGKGVGGSSFQIQVTKAALGGLFG